MSQRNVCYIVFSSRHRAQIDFTSSQKVHFQNIGFRKFAPVARCIVPSASVKRVCS